MVIHWTGAVSGPTIANGKSLTNASPVGCDVPVTVVEPSGDPTRAAIGCSVLFSTNVSTGLMGSAGFNCDTVGQGTITLEHSSATTSAADAILQPHWEDNATDTLTVNCLRDDKISSLGKFQIEVSADFTALMADYPGYDNHLSTLTSPRLFDPNTVIGVSAYHLDGDATDTNGASVGTAETIISDGDFSLVPAGFEGPAGTREVHTEVRELDLAFGSVHVRAGTDAPDQPISPGEVESQNPSGETVDDFPADSFFNVFVEVDLPSVDAFPGGTLFNSDPLLVLGSDLTILPPKVVYEHGNSEGVPVFFKDTEPGFWQAGDLFGWLIIAGHGASFENTPEDIAEFDQIFADEIASEPLPIPDSDGGGAPDDLEIAEGGVIGNPADDAAILALDSDQDGCTNGQELGQQETAGGLRDPLYYFDSMDMWVNKQKDRVVNIIDIGAIVKRFGSADAGATADPNRNSDPLDPPQDLISYHPSADRSPPIGPNLWNAGPPDGGIDIIEIGLAVVQFGHNCN